MAYSRISIIYNPNSTGDSQAQAEQLAHYLKDRLDGTNIECVPTKHAGHAEQLAKQIAQSEQNPLIISSSGDGGYNEVINGVIASGNQQAICAVLPAGNANDHSRAMHDRPLEELIVEQSTKQIDVLEAAIHSGGTQQVRYAHSYIGLGITPVVAVELNKHSLNAFLEVFVVMKSFMKYRPFRIRHDGAVHKLDSLIFGNINTMAKVLTLAPQNRPDDGKFEIVWFPGGSKWGLIQRLAKAAANAIDHVSRAEQFSFTTMKRMPMQLDGEVTQLRKGAKVNIRNDRRRLTVIA